MPDWLATGLLSFLGIAILFAIIPVVVMALVYFERKVIARMQDRYGPNRVGPFGILQPVADALKLLTKEDIVPAGADKLLFALSPIIVLSASLMVWAVVPFAPGLAVADLNVAVLFVIAMSGLPSIGFVMAGWASDNKYSLLGGMRAAAQFVSYEIPGILAVLVPVLLAGSMSLQDIVRAQSAGNWYLFYFPIGPLAFLIFLIAGTAESNRTPFDLVEAESEIIAGFHTEYSGMRFALFFLAEYANVFVISALGSVFFLGGWDGPILPPYVWFMAKVSALVFVFFWFRGTLPRLRYDQLMHFAWKRLFPIALANVALTALAIVYVLPLLGLR
ncbi:MAG: NADH-quinone oxidoreductase subunit NuoH [Chloroflexota bacterium]